MNLLPAARPQAIEPLVIVRLLAIADITVASNIDNERSRIHTLFCSENS
jgi:hypothetical protein